MGRNPVEFRRQYQAWIVTTKCYAEAWIKVVAGDVTEKDRLPLLLKECKEAHQAIKEEWEQLFRSSSL